jgi:phosphoenolpyruvate carboxykinase (ATP)
LIRAAICGDLNEKEMREDEIFHLAYPRICDGVPAEILNPASTWKSLEEYAFQAKKLMELFKQNKIY